MKSNRSHSSSGVVSLLAILVLAFSSFGAFSTEALAQTYVFGEADFATGASPVALVAGDFNTDGKLDLATANSGDNIVSVLIGKPDGTFQPHVDYKVGTSPSAIATGDFNGDSKPDLAVANSADGTVSILLGNGDGTFQVAGHYGTGSAPASVAVGDFNGDGKPDLAVANSGSNSVSVLIGRGDGTFAAPVDYPTGSGPVSVATADFSSDGKLDLVVANNGDAMFSILLGSGNGTFEPATNSGFPLSGLAPMQVVVADLNGDAKPDLVFAMSNSSEQGSSSVSVALGNGDGTFSWGLGGTANGGTTGSVAVGDFNRDGKLDVVIEYPAAYPDALAVLLGNGDGSFSNLPPGISYGTGWPPPPGGSAPSLIAGDFNGDGGLDVALANPGSNAVSVFLGDFDGTFQGRLYADGVGNHYDSFGPMAAADFNGDGKLDLVGTSACRMDGCYSLLASGVSISLGKGDGTFSAGSSYNLISGADSYWPPSQIEIGDFNADGKLDIAAQDTTYLLYQELTNWYLLVGNGDGTFQTPVVSSTEPSGTLFTPFVDFNGDGIADQVALGSYGTGLSILLGGSSQTLPVAIGNEPGFLIPGMTAADFGGDGIADLALIDQVEGSPFTIQMFEMFLNRAVIALYPNQLTFTIGADGTAATSQSVTVSNPGLAPLKISSVNVTGDFTQTNNCGSTLFSAVSCVITVTSNATGAGTGSISIADNAPGSPHLIGLTAVLPSAPGASLTPESLSFASQQVGTTSTKQSVTLTSTGDAPLTITSITITGDFAETSTCGGSLAAGATCTISVTFTPTASGTRTGTMSISDSAAGSPQIVNLTGTGTTAPVVTLSASTMSVGSQALGKASAAHTLTLTNSGNGVLTVSGITSSGDFAETNNCGGSVAAGASCTINVTFTPTVAGTRTGTITISDNAPGSPHIVSLTGTGTGPAVSFSAATMSVGGQVVGTTSAAHKLTLTNTGNAALSITGMTLSSASFSETNTCGSSLAAGASCTITVTFTPSAGGEITGMLSITDNASGSPHQVTLSGMGQDFTIGPYNLTHSMPAGFSAAYDLEVAPEGGFNQAVSLACSGAPPQGSCSVTPASMTLDGRNHAVITLRVTTMAPAAVPVGYRVPPVGASRPLSLPPTWLPALAGSILVLLTLLLALLLTGGSVAAWNRPASVLPSSGDPSPKMRLRLRLLTPIGALLLLTMVWMACGGGGTSFVTSTPTGGTPSGDYAITVTATSGNLTHVLTVELTVR